MRCPECGSWQVGVVDTRERDGYRWRRYHCRTCGVRFNTKETVMKVGKEARRER